MATATLVEYHFQVAPENDGQRLDVCVAALTGIPSRTQARRLIEEGRVTVNGDFPTKAGARLSRGDRVYISVPPPAPAKAVAEDIPLDIVYEDDHLMVVNKAKGMVVHPAPGHPSGTLVNALLYHCPSLSGIGGVRRPGIVHRLDKETSGLLLVAKTERAHRRLVSELRQRNISRIYLALIHGDPATESGTIDAPIGRHPVQRKKMTVVERGRGRDAVTHFTVLERFGDYSYLQLKLETGRTHQIRVHLSYIGHPVVGDTRYGPRKPHFFDDGQALHAWRLTFNHPQTNEAMSCEAPPPPSFEGVLAELRGEARHER